MNQSLNYVYYVYDYILDEYIKLFVHINYFHLGLIYLNIYYKNLFF